MSAGEVAIVVAVGTVAGLELLSLGIMHVRFTWRAARESRDFYRR